MAQPLWACASLATLQTDSLQGAGSPSEAFLRKPGDISMIRTAGALALLAGIAAAHAEPLDCAALEPSALAEPDGYALQCGVPAAAAPVSPVGPAAVTDTAYAVELRTASDPLYSFPMNNFPALTLVGVTAQQTYALDFAVDGTVIHAVQDTLTLVTIDPATGAFTTVGPVTGDGVAGNPLGLAIHPRTGAAFLALYTGSESQLFSLDLATAEATLIGSMGTELFIDIALNCDGEMYSHNISTDTLHSVDVATGATTLVGPTGVAANFAQGMDFDNDDGTLYAWMYTGGGGNQFGSLDLATGAFTSLANGVSGEYEGAIPTACPVVDADVAIAKSAQVPAAMAVGDGFTFTLDVANAGPAPASNVAIADVLPAGVAYVGNDCGASYSAGTLAWTVGAMPVGGTATCVVDVTASAPGPIENTATATADSPDPDSTNNSATVAIAGVPDAADLSLSKTAAAPASYLLGAQFDYTLDLANAGPAPASAVVVSDTLPGNLAHVANDCGAVVAGNTLTWNLGSLANGLGASCVVTVQITGVGSISNTATASSATTDPDPGNNSSTLVLAGVPDAADLSLLKTAAAPASPEVGSQFDYTLAVANAGPAPAGSVAVTDILPANLVHVANTCGAAVAGNTVTWTLGTVAQDSGAGCVITVEVIAIGAISNTATVGSATSDPVPANNSSTVVLGGVADLADLELAMSAAAPSSFLIGTRFDYTLALVNEGPAPANGVSVSDTLPSNLLYIANDCGAAASGNALTWTVGTLANGADLECSVTVEVTAIGPIANTATVASATADPDAADNSSTLVLAGVANAADLSLAKTATIRSRSELGSQVDYQLQVTNAGPAPVTNAVVTDTLPSRIVHVANTCGATVAGQTVTWTVGALAHDGMATCIITVAIVGRGPITNVASVASDVTDPVPANNSGTASIAGATALIPADAPWALLMLILGALGGAVIALRR